MTAKATSYEELRAKCTPGLWGCCSSFLRISYNPDDCNYLAEEISLTQLPQESPQ